MRSDRRLARLYRASLDTLIAKLGECERGSDRARSTELFRSISNVLSAMPPSAKPSLDELYDALPVRHRALLLRAQRQRDAQAGILPDDPYQPANPQPNTAWEDYEVRLTGEAGNV